MRVRCSQYSFSLLLLSYPSPLIDARIQGQLFPVTLTCVREFALLRSHLIDARIQGQLFPVDIIIMCAVNLPCYAATHACVTRVHVNVTTDQGHS